MATEPLSLCFGALPARPLLAPRWAATLGDVARLLAQVARAVGVLGRRLARSRRGCTCPCPAT